MSKIQRSPDDPARVGLVLTREIDEVIMIGDDIKVMVVDIRDGTKVRLGISAPAGVSVHRKEVYDQIKAGVPKKQAMCRACGGKGCVCCSTHGEIT